MTMGLLRHKKYVNKSLNRMFSVLEGFGKRNQEAEVDRSVQKPRILVQRS